MPGGRQTAASVPIRRSIPRAIRSALPALCFLLLAALWRGAPAPAFAHGAPVDLAYWGPFIRVVASCQRQIGHAGAQCGLGAWAAREACLREELQGGTCDEQAVDDFIDAVPRKNARDAVSAACSG